ncbi:hypothetical protein ACA910_018454 [Epithemia clementina (nom. ined.)]
MQFPSTSVGMIRLVVFLTTCATSLAAEPSGLPTNLRPTDLPIHGGIHKSGGGSSSGSKDTEEDDDNNDGFVSSPTCRTSCLNGDIRVFAIDCLLPGSYQAINSGLYDAPEGEGGGSEDFGELLLLSSNICNNVKSYCNRDKTRLDTVNEAPFCNPVLETCRSTGVYTCSAAWFLCVEVRTTAPFCESYLSRSLQCPKPSSLSSLSTDSITTLGYGYPTTSPTVSPTSLDDCSKNLLDWLYFLQVYYPICTLAPVRSQSDLEYYADLDTKGERVLVGISKDDEAMAFQCRKSRKNHDMDLDVCYEGWSNIADNSPIANDPDYWKMGQPNGRSPPWGGADGLATTAYLRGDGSPALRDASAFALFNHAVIECCVDFLQACAPPNPLFTPDVLPDVLSEE